MPPITDGNYIVRRAITESLVQARDKYVRRGARVLDAGCGVKPYFPLFERTASEYVGVDLAPGPFVDVVSPLDSLPFEDSSFDLVLCTQVLEHVAEPLAIVTELARVLRPGGALFLTTHGVFPFHPDPCDYWRWTQQGLELLVDRTSELELIELVPHGGTIACFAFLVAFYVDAAATRLRWRVLSQPLTALLNLGGLAADRRIRSLQYPRRHTLVANFLLVARRRRV